MTKRSKIILLSSILLALSVIISAVISMIEGRGIVPNTLAMVISVIIIIVSMISVILIYLLKIRRKPNEIKLNESFLREFEIIKDIVMNSTLPRSYKKMIIEDVLEMLLTAQADGRSAESAIGDPTVFTQDIIGACTSKPRVISNLLIDGAMAFILFTLLTSLLLWSEDISESFFSQGIDISMVLFYAAIAFVLIPIIKQLIMKKSIWAYVLPLISGLAFIGITKLLRVFFYENTLVKTLLDGMIVMIPNMAVLVFLVTALLLLFVLRLNLRRLPKLQ